MASPKTKYKYAEFEGNTDEHEDQAEGEEEIVLGRDRLVGNQAQIQGTGDAIEHRHPV